MKILVTGIAGFLGSHLADFLSDEYEVTGVYNRQKPDILFPAFSSDEEIPGEFDAIVLCHASVSAGNNAKSESELTASNIDFTQKIVSRFGTTPMLYISTVSVFKPSPHPIIENSPVAPQSLYADTKLSGENAVRQASRSAVLRVSSLYGNGMKNGTLIPNYVDQALENREIAVWGNGSRLQNYFHVSDAVALISAILQKGVFQGETYLGTDVHSYTNLEVANQISALTDSEIVFVNEDRSASAIYDGSFTRKAVTWQPQTRLEHGLRAYIEWKKKQF